MNDITGQFRIAKGSHLDASPVPDDIGQPLPNEELAGIEAGDLLCELQGQSRIQLENNSPWLLN